MHVVQRWYSGATALADLLAQRSQEVEQLLSDIPGFRAYYAVRSGNDLTTITVCDDQTGTQESTRRAGEWVRQNLIGDSAVAPMVNEGEAIIHFTR
jgi:hypothetical protein